MDGDNIKKQSARYATSSVALSQTEKTAQPKRHGSASQIPTVVSKRLTTSRTSIDKTDGDISRHPSMPTPPPKRRRWGLWGSFSAFRSTQSTSNIHDDTDTYRWRGVFRLRNRSASSSKLQASMSNMTDAGTAGNSRYSSRHSLDNDENLPDNQQANSNIKLSTDNDSLCDDNNDESYFAASAKKANIQQHGLKSSRRSYKNPFGRNSKKVPPAKSVAAESVAVESVAVEDDSSVPVPTFQSLMERMAQHTKELKDISDSLVKAHHDQAQQGEDVPRNAEQYSEASITNAHILWASNKDALLAASSPSIELNTDRTIYPLSQDKIRDLTKTSNDVANWIKTVHHKKLSFGAYSKLKTQKETMHSTMTDLLLNTNITTINICVAADQSIRKELGTYLEAANCLIGRMQYDMLQLDKETAEIKRDAEQMLNMATATAADAALREDIIGSQKKQIQTLETEIALLPANAQNSNKPLLWDWRLWKGTPKNATAQIALPPDFMLDSPMTDDNKEGSQVYNMEDDHSYDHGSTDSQSSTGTIDSDNARQTSPNSESELSLPAWMAKNIPDSDQRDRDKLDRDKLDRDKLDRDKFILDRYIHDNDRQQHSIKDTTPRYHSKYFVKYNTAFEQRPTDTQDTMDLCKKQSQHDDVIKAAAATAALSFRQRIARYTTTIVEYYTKVRNEEAAGTTEAAGTQPTSSLHTSPSPSLRRSASVRPSTSRSRQNQYDTQDAAHGNTASLSLPQHPDNKQQGLRRQNSSASLGNSTPTRTFTQNVKSKAGRKQRLKYQPSADYNTVNESIPVNVGKTSRKALDVFRKNKAIKSITQKLGLGHAMHKGDQAIKYRSIKKAYEIYQGQYPGIQENAAWLLAQQNIELEQLHYMLQCAGQNIARQKNKIDGLEVKADMLVLKLRRVQFKDVLANIGQTFK